MTKVREDEGITSGAFRLWGGPYGSEGTFRLLIKKGRHEPFGSISATRQRNALDIQLFTRKRDASKPSHRGESVRLIPFRSSSCSCWLN